MGGSLEKQVGIALYLWYIGSARMQHIDDLRIMHTSVRHDQEYHSHISYPSSVIREKAAVQSAPSMGQQAFGVSQQAKRLCAHELSPLQQLVFHELPRPDGARLLRHGSWRRSAPAAYTIVTVTANALAPADTVRGLACAAAAL